MEKNKMSTQLKFRDRACQYLYNIAKLVADYPGFHISQLSLKFRARTEASINCLGKTQGPAPCCFVILNHHMHGAGTFTQLKFRVGAKANSSSPGVKPRADAPSLSNPLNIMAAHWGSL